MNAMTKPDTLRSTIAAGHNLLPKPDLITVEEAKAMDVARLTDLFKSHLNPGQLHFMKLLGFHKIKIERAEGMYYFDQNGRKILDFFGGFGSLAFGHDTHHASRVSSATPQTPNPHDVTAANASDSVVRGRNGQVVAIGGLMRQASSSDRSQIPGAGDVPVVGSLAESGAAR